MCFFVGLDVFELPFGITLRIQLLPTLASMRSPFTLSHIPSLHSWGYRRRLANDSPSLCDRLKLPSSRLAE